MSKIVIADSSCLIGLSKIGQLNILKALFGQVIIPAAVYQEVVIQGTGKAGSEEIQKAEWIICQTVQDTLAVKTLRTQQLGKGECEAMVLALESQAEFVILDDGKARKIALSLELPIIGTVALLHKAAQKGFLNDDLNNILEQLKRVGFRYINE